ncbi:MAG: DUF6691 family protein [Bdellovibrionota bacterium]
MKLAILGFLVGLIFSLGLGISGMTQPAKVQGFLDFFGDWDFSLAFVMIGAIAVHTIFYRWVKHRQSPLFGGHFHLPTKRDWDSRLIFGALIFGAGWGLAGFCPGPAMTSMAALNTSAMIFVIAMLAGMAVFHFANEIWSKK